MRRLRLGRLLGEHDPPGSTAGSLRRPHNELQLARAVWGGTLLLAPRPLLARAGTASDPIVKVTRVLGARHLLEALILSRWPQRPPPRWPVVVDGIHAATMIAVATGSRRLRSEALASAAVAGLLAGWTEIERKRA